MGQFQMLCRYKKKFQTKLVAADEPCVGQLLLHSSNMMVATNPRQSQCQINPMSNWPKTRIPRPWLSREGDESRLLRPQISIKMQATTSKRVTIGMESLLGINWGLDDDEWELDIDDDGWDDNNLLSISVKSIKSSQLDDKFQGLSAQIDQTRGRWEDSATRSFNSSEWREDDWEAYSPLSSWDEDRCVFSFVEPKQRSVWFSSVEPNEDQRSCSYCTLLSRAEEALEDFL